MKLVFSIDKIYLNLVFWKEKIEQNLKFRSRTRGGCTEILNEPCVLYREDSNDYCPLKTQVSFKLLFRGILYFVKTRLI